MELEKLVQDSNPGPIATQTTVYANAPHQLTPARTQQINALLTSVHVEVTRHVMLPVKSARTENACVGVFTVVTGNYQGLIVIVSKMNVNARQQ